MKMRRHDRKISSDECIRILNANEYGVLSMSTKENEGYGIPLNYVYLNDSIYFHCALKGRKLKEISDHNKVSFCIVGRTEIIPQKFTSKYESVIVFGKASEVNGEEKRNALTALIKKYSKDYLSEGIAYIETMFDITRVYKIEISEMTGKASRG